VVAFAAWLGVHVALLSSTKAKIQTVMEWVWAYLGWRGRGNAILTRTEELQINWSNDGEESVSASLATTKGKQTNTTL